MLAHCGARFVCPICCDVLQQPVKLPCCGTHLWCVPARFALRARWILLIFKIATPLLSPSLECFQHGHEITTSNCFFCRKRLASVRRLSKVTDLVDAELDAEIKVLNEPAKHSQALFHYFIIRFNVCPAGHVSRWGWRRSSG